MTADAPDEITPLERLERFRALYRDRVRYEREAAETYSERDRREALERAQNVRLAMIREAPEVQADLNALGGELAGMTLIDAPVRGGRAHVVEFASTLAMSGEREYMSSDLVEMAFEMRATALRGRPARRVRKVEAEDDSSNVQTCGLIAAGLGVVSSLITIGYFAAAVYGKLPAWLPSIHWPF